MPRSARRSASAGSPSWLFAAPAITRHRNDGIVVRVQDAAGRARREHVALDLGDPVRRDHLGLELLGQLLGPHVVDVGEREPRTGLREEPRQRIADGADTLDRDGPPVQVVGAERVADRRPDPVEDADGRVRSRRARAAVGLGAAEDARGAFGDHVHVRRSGVHVAGRDVGAVERLDQVTVAEHQLASGLALRDLGDREHGLAAPERHRRHRHLARHRRGQPEDVAEPVGGLRRTSSCGCRRPPDPAPSNAPRRTSTSRSARRTGRRPPRRPRPGAGPRTRATRTASWTSWPSSPRASP